MADITHDDGRVLQYSAFLRRHGITSADVRPVVYQKLLRRIKESRIGSWITEQKWSVVADSIVAYNAPSA